MKTKAEMNALFEDVPEALSNTLEILDKVEYYSIDHAPIMPTFAIPEDFGTEEGYRQKYTEKDLFDEFTQDENGKVVLDEDAANAKIKRLGVRQTVPYQAGSRLSGKVGIRRCQEVVR